ncbi:hypothetical protein [Foetidibacter luteolus]|uniref:hypothetical protein n=1 Tax=Foetidibacter luteolus TaxID=2608880 RepID=UPI00129AA3D8|nr:hypothetical protein [Foetidibacter luteolus]
MDQHYLDPMQEKKLPGSINVLTILTFIGSGITLLFSVFGFVRAEQGYKDMEKAINSDDFEKMPSFLKNMMTPEMLEAAKKSFENRVPILILNLIAVGLCIYGAMEMRKLKAGGYWMWLAGELLPFITIILFSGMAYLTGFNGYIGIGIALLFIILYSTQRKYLTK